MPSPLQDLESDVRVTYDAGYLCADFSLTRPLCFRLRPDARDRQTDVVRRQTRDAHHRLMPPPYRGGDIITPKAHTVGLLGVFVSDPYPSGTC